MGQSITSATDMMSYAGDLRRAAKQAPTPETAQKIQTSAQHLEKAALARVGLTAPGIGKLLRFPADFNGGWLRVGSWGGPKSRAFSSRFRHLAAFPA